MNIKSIQNTQEKVVKHTFIEFQSFMLFCSSDFLKNQLVHSEW